jgi:hypothetical protein
MSFEPIRRILPKAIAGAGIVEQVTAARVVAEAGRALTRLWGEEKAAYVDVVSFRDGQLKLRIGSSVARQELRVWETRLINEVNRLLGRRTVFRLLIVE